MDVYPWTGGELVYCDPPYVRSTRSSQRDLYRYEMTDEDHRALLTVLKRLTCPVIISGYWSELYAEELGGWRTINFTVVKRGGQLADEWLWCNFPEPIQLHDYSHLGIGFRERERIKRKRLRWERMLRQMPPLEAHALAAAIATVSDERSCLVSDDDAGHPHTATATAGDTADGRLDPGHEWRGLKNLGDHSLPSVTMTPGHAISAGSKPYYFLWVSFRGEDRDRWLRCPSMGCGLESGTGRIID